MLPIGEVASLVAAEFTGWQIVTAVAVCAAESGYNAYAINVVGDKTRGDGTPNLAYRSIDVGLFQINSYWWPNTNLADMLDSAANVAQARTIFGIGYNADPSASYSVRVRAGWSQWVTYRTGAHKRYLAEAVTVVRAGKF